MRVFKLMVLCYAVLYSRADANTVSGTFQTCSLECSQDHQGRQRQEQQQLSSRVTRGKQGPKGTRGQQGVAGPKGDEGRSCDTGEFERLKETVKDLQGVFQNLTTDKERLEHDVQVLTDLLKFSVKDCGDMQKLLPNFTSGMYTINPPGLPPRDVWCDEDEDGLAWTVIQKRYDGRVDFNRKFSLYENGFGDVSGEHWAGLKTINRLTMNGDWQLHISVEGFDGTVAQANYGSFRVGSSPSYSLSISSFSGNTGDSLAFNNGMKFTSFDNDQDTWSNNCAAHHKGAWWFRGCGHSCLNGFRYSEGSTQPGFWWYHLHDKWIAVSGSTMKIRRT